MSDPLLVTAYRRAPVAGARAIRRSARRCASGSCRCAWHPDAAEHDGAIAARRSAWPRARARGSCACRSSRCSPYFAVDARRARAPAGVEPEPLPGGADLRVRGRRSRPRPACSCTRRCYEARRRDGGLGLQHRVRGRARRRARRAHAARPTCRSPRATTRTRGSGPATPAGRSSTDRDARVRLPDVLGPVVPGDVARRTRSRGAEVLVYPTAIGSEPDHPDFDTEPLWEQVIRAKGIMNGTFMIVP